MVLKVVVDNRLRFSYENIPKEMFNEIKAITTYGNPEYFKNKNSGYGTRGIPQEIMTYEIYPNKLMSLARGSSYKLKEIAKKHEVELSFIDNRIEAPYKFETKIKLRDYQIKPFRQLVNFQNALIQGVCGCGKTIILLKAIEEIGQKTLIIVHERKLQQQWLDEIVKHFGIPEEEVGLIGGISKGKNRVKPITIAMQQSLLRNGEKYKDEFGCIVCDEVHRFAASTFQKVIDIFPAKYRIGATATPKRKDGKHFLVFDQFGKIVAEITDKDLLELGMTHEVKIVVVYTDFKYNGKKDRRFRQEVVGTTIDGSMIYENVAIEKINYNDLLEHMIMDKDRNRLIYRFLEAEVENKNYCILLSDRRKFCHNWQNWLEQKDIEAKLLVGGNEHKEEGDEAIRRIREDGDLHVVIGTTVADEGLDITRLNRGFSANPTATNERRIIQQTGRIKRKCEGKSDAIWYYFYDHMVEGFERHLKLLNKYFDNVETLSTIEEIDSYLETIKK